MGQLLSLDAEVRGQLSDTRGDVITHQSHAFDSVATALGRLVDVPGLDAGALDWFRRAPHCPR